MEVEPPDFFDDETFESIPGSSSSQVMMNDESMTDEPSTSEVKEEAGAENLEGWYFETDHPALRDNEDYRKLLKAVVILESQRAQAIRDLDKLHEIKEEAMRDPIAFVERLQRGEKIDFPAPQTPHPLPSIDWDKYALQPPAFGRRQQTRHSTKAAQDLIKNSLRVKPRKDKELKEPLNKTNLYWTAEEQQRLEELLRQFPPEEVESRRWEKIAKSLGNRTPIQVASRVQKYFIKLMKAGMPIPGRMPNIAYIKKPKRNVLRHQPSTFMVSHTLPVLMPPEADDDFLYTPCLPSPDENSQEFKADISDEDDVTPELRETDEYKELLMLKRILKEKRLKKTRHLGFQCCRCKVEPIIGIRWQCTECKPPSSSVNFCEDCVGSTFETGQHSSNHKLENIHDVNTSFPDQDYRHFQGSD